MRIAQGWAEIVDPSSSQLITEYETITCPHCGTVEMTRSPSGKLEVIVFRDDGTFYNKEVDRCRSCWQYVCPKCLGKPCDNRFRRLEEEERRGVIS